MSSNVELMLAMITALIEPDKDGLQQVSAFESLRKEMKLTKGASSDLEWALLAVTLIDMVAALHPDDLSASDVWCDIAKAIHLEADEDLSQVTSFSHIEALGEIIAFNFVNSIEDEGYDF